ncbi:hypothetical protein MUK42_11993 [Musa troglodytarum]|uniref:Uncharacterized protein n=1 Tax=Musa troglodytarum TaxID=320322 RepID=A0A9E7I3K4_9LILI|nr:hypothetical protein MUK42_11993 [Musa troglodytarum]
MTHLKPSHGWSQSCVTQALPSLVGDVVSCNLGNVVISAIKFSSTKDTNFSLIGQGIGPDEASFSFINSFGWKIIWQRAAMTRWLTIHGNLQPTPPVSAKEEAAKEATPTAKK